MTGGLSKGRRFKMGPDVATRIAPNWLWCPIREMVVMMLIVIIKQSLSNATMLLFGHRELLINNVFFL